MATTGVESDRLSSSGAAAELPPGIARCLVGLLLICAAVRGWMIHQAEVIAADGPRYIEMSRQWSINPLGVIKKYDYHVGYAIATDRLHTVLVAAGMGNTVRSWELAAQGVSLLAAVAATAALWSFARICFGWQVALVTVLLSCVARKWAGLGADVMSDALAVAFMLWAVVLGLKTLELLRRNSARAIVTAAGVGLCAGAGYLVRPEAVLPLGLAGAMWLFFLVRERFNWKQTLGSLIVASITAAVSMAPYIMIIGSFTKKKRLTDVVAAPASDVLRSYVHAGLTSAGFSPLRALAQQLMEAMHPLPAVVAAVWLAAWILNRWVRPGIFRRLIPSLDSAGAFLMIATALVLSPILMRLQANVNYLDYRHVLFLALMLLPLAGAGTLFMADLIATWLSQFPRQVRSWPCLLLPLGFAMGMSVLLFIPLHQGKRYYAQAGEYLAGVARPGDRIFADHMWILHYSQLPGQQVDLSGIPARKILEWIAGDTPPVTYVAFSDSAIAEYNPALAGMLRWTAFREVHQVTQSAAKNPDTIRVYRVDRQALKAELKKR